MSPLRLVDTGTPANSVIFGHRVDRGAKVGGFKSPTFVGAASKDRRCGQKWRTRPVLADYNQNRGRFWVDFDKIGHLSTTVGGINRARAGNACGCGRTHCVTFLTSRENKVSKNDTVYTVITDHYCNQRSLFPGALVNLIFLVSLFCSKVQIEHSN